MQGSAPQLYTLKPSLASQVFYRSEKQVNAPLLPEQGENASGIKQSLFIFKLPAQDFQESSPSVTECVHKKLCPGV